MSEPTADEPTAATESTGPAPPSGAPADVPAEAPAGSPAAVPAAGEIDLLGVLAYAELQAFLRLAADADGAPTQPLKSQMAGLAVLEYEHHRRLLATLTNLGIDPATAMAPFTAAIDSFHDRARPSDWLEGLVKAYIGDGIATDFYAEIAQYVAEPTRGVILSCLEDGGQAEFIIGAVRDAIKADPKVGGRLALFGRRMVGEALTQGQQVAVERDGLADLVINSGTGRGDLAEIGRLFVRLTDRHATRMARLGLAA